MTNQTHLDADRLADLHAGLLDEQAGAAARDHLAGCPVCSADYDVIAGVPAALAGLADVGEMPDDVVRRIDRALAGAAATSATSARTVTPLHAERRQGPRGMRLLQAAAVLVLLLAGGALGVSALSGGDERATSVSAGAAGGSQSSTTRVPVTASGRNWTRDSLAAAGPAFAARTLGPAVGLDSRESGGGTDRAKSGAPVPSAAALDDATSRLRSPAALTACARNLAGDDTPPLSVDLARFEGKPAAVFAFASPVDTLRVDLFVVSPDCPTGSFLYYASVPRS